MGLEADVPDDRFERRHLDALISVASISDDVSFEYALDRVADAIDRATGFTSVVFNLRDSSSSAFVATVSRGTEEACAALEGNRNDEEVFLDLLRPEFRSGRGFVHLIPPEYEAEGSWYEVDRDAPTAPGAWKPLHAMLVPLHDSTGGLFGVISVDDPETGVPPNPVDLVSLEALAVQASMALQRL